jgi:hypothetical protein
MLGAFHQLVAFPRHRASTLASSLLPAAVELLSSILENEHKLAPIESLSNVSIDGLLDSFWRRASSRRRPRPPEPLAPPALRLTVNSGMLRTIGRRRGFSPAGATNEV